MLVKCNKCNAKYEINAESIGADGRIAQCSRCGNQWVQYLKDTAKTSIKKQKPGFCSWVTNILAFVFIMLISIITTSYFQENLPDEFSALFSRIGLFSTKGLVLSNIEIDEEHGISGKIVNFSTHNREMPIIRIGLKTGSGKQSFYIYPDKSIIRPKGVKEISYKIQYLPKSITKITMDIGNFLELAMR